MDKISGPHNSSKMKSKKSAKSTSDQMNAKQTNEYDSSVLRKPLTTSISGLTKALKLFETATKEVQDYLTNECDILYECRICRSIFRSLANFIMHKRSYCQEKFDINFRTKWTRNDENDCLDVFQSEPNDIKENHKNKKDDIKTKKNLNSIVESLAQKKQFGFEMENFSIGEFYDEINKQKSDIDDEELRVALQLENIEGTDNGVFQTLRSRASFDTKKEEMKLEVLEIHTMLEGQSAVLGPDGKVLNLNKKFGSNLKSSVEDSSENLICRQCNINFATRKTFFSHIKYKHENSRLVYPCPECTDTFATVWSVYRHLYNIHRKTLTQVRKMRTQIQAKALRRNEVPIENKSTNERATRRLNEQQKIDEENQAWMDNFEADNDLQMCGGCGRRFERKAALNSHSQTCQKRIAAKNLINQNRQKRSTVIDDPVKPLPEKRNSSRLIKTDHEVGVDNKRSLDNNKQMQQTMNVAKKRKIAIQIRCDYNKRTDMRTSSNIEETSEKENSGKTSDSDLNRKLADSNSQTGESESSPDIFTIMRVDKNIQLETRSSKVNNPRDDITDSDVVSIPSTDSSPNKDDQDQLSIKDEHSDIDSEIEDILSPEFETISPKSENKHFKHVNESTLKLIKLINSDIPEENDKPTLDTVMTNYVALKKLQCCTCNLKFSNISKLRCHMALHFNWMRFKCDICAFKAYDKMNVYDHVKARHNIQEFDKIEAIIFQIPDWETSEMSSKIFLSINELNNDNFSVASTSEEKKELDSSGNITPDSCILIESGEQMMTRSLKNKGQAKRFVNKKTMKIKKKIENVIDNDLTSKEAPETNDLSDNDRPVSRSSSFISNSMTTQDEATRKMVYEVIFGQEASVIKTKSTTDEKDNMKATTVAAVSVSSVISRPVRHRVKPINKDFIYDMHDFKEQPKTVHICNNNRNLLQSIHPISESLEDNNSSKKTNNAINQRHKNLVNCFINMDNTVNKLNLQKNSNEITFDKRSKQVPRDAAQVYAIDNITIVDSKSLLKDPHSDGDDDDIYIVENEELVAVK